MAEFDHLYIDDEDISSVIKETEPLDHSKEKNKAYGDVNLCEKSIFGDPQKTRDELKVFTPDPGMGGYVMLESGGRSGFNGRSEDYGTLPEEDRTGQTNWKERRDYVYDEEGNQDTEVIDVCETCQADVEELNNSEDKIQVDEGDFSTAKEPVQPTLEFSDMDQLIEAVKAGKINIGAILKEPRSIIGFYFYHYLMIENICNESFKIIHLEKNIISACCKIIEIHFSASNQNVSVNFNNGVILCKNYILNENDRKAMHGMVEEYLLKPFIPYYIKSNKGFNCETFLEYLKSGEMKPSLEVQNVEEKYGKLVSYPIGFLDIIFFLLNTTTEIIEYIE